MNIFLAAATGRFRPTYGSCVLRRRETDIGVSNKQFKLSLNTHPGASVRWLALLFTDCEIDEGVHPLNEWIYTLGWVRGTASQLLCLSCVVGGARDGRFGSKVSQIGPKWDKSGDFSDQISVHLAPGRQMH